MYRLIKHLMSFPMGVCGGVYNLLVHMETVCSFTPFKRKRREGGVLHFSKACMGKQSNLPPMLSLAKTSVIL